MILRYIPFRTLIILFVVILNEDPFIAATSTKQEPWYAQLPDYYLHGVPQSIVDNEKNRDRFFKFISKYVAGEPGKNKIQIQKIRRLRVCVNTCIETLQHG